VFLRNAREREDLRLGREAQPGRVHLEDHQADGEDGTAAQADRFAEALGALAPSLLSLVKLE